LEYVALCREADSQAVRLLAIDPFADAFFRDLAPRRNEAGNTARADSIAGMKNELLVQSLIRLMVSPGQGLITEALASRLEIREGETLQILVSGEWKPIAIAGIIPSRRADQLADENLMVVDVATGQEILNRKGFVDRVELISAGAAVEKLASSLPPPLRLSRPPRRSQYVDSMLRSFRLNLTALSLLAVFVGMFLIYNTMMFSVLQRRKDIGILRSLGVTRKQIVANLLLESTLLGVIGSAFGLLLGFFLSRYTTQTIGATIRDLYVYVQIGDVELYEEIMRKGFLLGLFATWVAALVPVLEAAGIAPVVAMRRSSLELRTSRFAPTLSAGAVVFLAVAAILAFIPGGIFYGFAAALALALSAVFFTPAFTMALTGSLSTVVRRMVDITVLLAARSIRGALSRTSVAIAALTISLSMVLGMQIMINSFRASIHTWINSVLQADFYISPIGGTTARWQAVLPDKLIHEINALPEVKAVNTYRAAEFEYEGRLVYLVSIRADVLMDRTDFIFKQGRDSENWQALQRGEVFVSESFAQRFSVTAGDRVELLTATGSRAFRVAAVFVDYSLDQGQIMMDHATYAENWGPVRINSAGIFLKSGVAPQIFLSRLRAMSREEFAVQVSSNRQLRQQILEIFDQTFAITRVLQVLAMLVAFIGIVSAMLSLLIERTREFGTLRAVGMSLAQMRRTIALESSLMGGLASLLAAPAGFALALILVRVINVRSFGWSIALQTHPSEYAQMAALALLAALLAALYPMWRLKRISIAAALREE
jgi:putative ABC transport system permease protein